MDSTKLALVLALAHKWWQNRKNTQSISISISAEFSLAIKHKKYTEVTYKNMAELIQDTQDSFYLFHSEVSDNIASTVDLFLGLRTTHNPLLHK